MKPSLIMAELFREHGSKLTYRDACRLLGDRMPSEGTYYAVRKQLFGPIRQPKNNGKREHEANRMLVVLDALEALQPIADSLGGWSELRNLINAIEDIEVRQ